METCQLFYFQVRESPAPLNIPTPAPAPDHLRGVRPPVASFISHYIYLINIIVRLIRVCIDQVVETFNQTRGYFSSTVVVPSSEKCSPTINIKAFLCFAQKILGSSGPTWPRNGCQRARLCNLIILWLVAHRLICRARCSVNSRASCFVRSHKCLC